MKFRLSRPLTHAIAAILCVMAVHPAVFAARVRTTSRTATPPAAPSNLQAAAVSSSAVKLTWTDNSKNEGIFVIENASASSGPWSRLRVLAANTTSYTKSNLTSGATYYFRVRAANRQGDSANSNVASASLNATTPPAPGNLTASAASTSQINLSWTDNSSTETGFDVESATSSSGPWSQLASLGANTTAYAATGLASGQTYYFRAHAKNADGDSPYSNTANATTQSTTPPPPPPTTAGMPKGIYLLDDKSAPSRTGSMRQADKPYIDGFTWRMPWTSFDSGVSGPSYNFSAVTTAITSLQSLSNNKNNRMKLTLALFNQEVPQYVLNSSQNTFTTDAAGAGGSVLTVLPWDPTGLQAFRNFVHALAEYKVYDAVSGQTVAFRDHPALGQIDAGILGMQSYRDISSFTVVANPGYTREKFIQAVLDCLHAVRDEFPNKNVYMGFFSMDDNTRTPSLDSQVLAAITNEFDGVKNPRVGFFQELLRGDAPSMNGDYGKNLLSGGAAGCPILFQACSPWINKSLCTFTAGDDTPENGFENGYNNYGALYYEMYAADLAESSWQPMFQQWHDFLQAQ